MNRSIVCGIDTSRVARWGARVAAALAHEFDRRLVLVHVAADPPTFPYRDSRLRELRRGDLTRDATALLERVAAALPGVVPEVRVMFGDPVDALMAACHD